MINSHTINSIAINGTGNKVGKLSLSLYISAFKPTQIGFATLNLKITSFVVSSIALPLLINVHLPKDQLRLTLKINGYAKSSLALPLSISCYDSDSFNLQSSQWKIKLILNNIDVSTNLTNLLKIEAEESTAKIADFTLIPFAGPISITQWIGKEVMIYYQIFNNQHHLLSEVLLFQGVVDEPIYDPTTRLTNFTCTDQLQEKVENLTEQQIDALINGYWSSIVFNQPTDNWQYARDILSTVPVCLDIDRFNQLRVTPWQSKETHDYLFDEDNVFYQSIEVQLANRREIHNNTNITVQYRFPRLKQKEILFDYRYPYNFCEQNYRNSTLPNTDMIEQAIEGTGWLLKNKIEYIHQRGSGWVSCGGVTSGFLISERMRKYLVREARFILSKRYVQTVSELVNLSVFAPQSAMQFGNIDQSDSLSYETIIETDKFTQAVNYEYPVSKSVLDRQGNYVFDADMRIELNQAIATKLNQAKVAILKAHRNNLITFKTTIQPLIERRHTVKLDTQNVIAQGKVKHIVLECDFNQGSCQSTITFAVSRTEVQDQVPESEFTPPAKLANIEQGETIKRSILLTHIGGRVTAPQYNEAWNGYTGNEKVEPGAILYPERFAVITPAIDQEQAPIQYTVSHQYQINIPNELLLLSA